MTIRFAALSDRGVVTQVGTVPTADAIAALESEGMTIVLNPPDHVTFGAWHWDGAEWSIYVPTQAEQDATRAERLISARQEARLDKSTLLIRMVEAQILPPEDAEVAAGGEIPAAIQTVLNGLPPEVFPPEAYTVARIKWRSDNIISRTNPVIVLAGAALGVSDEGMDAIFGVSV